jgi:organic hydroperoxide reductase OsmC/OhrA
MIRKTDARAPQAPFETETVWDAGLAGTGSAVGGPQLIVGRDGDWGPEHLLLLAAESCFMDTLLSLAVENGIAVLGYVSNGKLWLRDGNGTPEISLLPCAVVGSAPEAKRLVEIGRRAQQESLTARLLGNRLHVTMDVRTIAAGAAA